MQGGETLGVVKVIELIGSSKLGFEDAVKNVVDEASKTVRGIKEVWVQDFKVRIENNKIAEYRACVKLSFIVEHDRC